MPPGLQPPALPARRPQSEAYHGGGASGRWGGGGLTPRGVRGSGGAGGGDARGGGGAGGGGVCDGGDGGEESVQDEAPAWDDRVQECGAGRSSAARATGTWISLSRCL